MRGVIAILCILLVQIYGHTRVMKIVDNPPDCAEGKCCIGSSGQILDAGSKAADTNGICQEYFCNSNNTYIVIQCLQWTGEDCELQAGKTNALYPDCCQMPVGHSTCTAKFS